MITEAIFRCYIERLGHIPACPSICVPKIIADYNNGKREFEFFINPHNLCWYLTIEIGTEPIGTKIKLNIREFKIDELLNDKR